MAGRYRGEGGAVWTLDEPLTRELADQVRTGRLVRLPDTPQDTQPSAEGNTGTAEDEAAQGDSAPDSGGSEPPEPKQAPVAASEPSPSDAKSAWVDYAVAHGESRKTADRRSKAELIEAYGQPEEG